MFSLHGESQTQALFFGFHAAKREDAHIFLCGHYLKYVSINKAQNK